MRKHNSLEEIFLGLGLGFGFMTKLRFFGPVGVSEILILLTILLLLKKYHKALFSFTKDLKGFIKGYLFFSIFIVSPIVTAVYYTLSDLNTMPYYLISFGMGWMLSFLLVVAIRDGFDMAKTTLWFALVFVLGNIIVMIFFPSLQDESIRFSGVAKNPNQLLFYGSSLSLLLVIYQKKLAFFLLPAITYILIKSGSDAYVLTLFVTVVAYIYLMIFFSKKFAFGLNILINFIIFTSILLYVVEIYGDVLVALWSKADEGGARIALMKNALTVALHSPLFGYGVGSFSGISAPYGRWEAHDTFLDFAMQFGFFFPIITYGLMFGYFFKSVKFGNFFVSGFILAFIVASMFHFTGRHFNFWVELAIFYYYIFYEKNTNDSMGAR